MKAKKIQDAKRLIKEAWSKYHNPRTQDRPTWYDILLLCDYLKTALKEVIKEN